MGRRARATSGDSKLRDRVGRRPATEQGIRDFLRLGWTTALAGSMIGAGAFAQPVGSPMERPASVRIPRISLDVRWYGALPDDGLDDVEAIEEALKAARTGSTVLFSEGVYDLARPLDIRFRAIEGVLPNRTPGTVWRVHPDADLSAAVVASSSGGVSLENVRIQCEGRADYGIHFQHVNESETRLENVVVSGARSAGFRLERCQAANFSRLLALNNLGDGFQIEDCNGSSFMRLQAVLNQGTGIAIFGGVNFSGGCFFTHGRSEANGGHGVSMDGATSMVSLEKFWIEANALDGVRLSDVRVARVRDCRIAGTALNGNRAIRLSDQSRQCVIDGNFVSGEGSLDYRVLEVEAGSADNVLTSNTRLVSGDTYEALPVVAVDVQRHEF